MRELSWAARSSIIAAMAGCTVLGGFAIAGAGTAAAGTTAKTAYSSTPHYGVIAGYGALCLDDWQSGTANGNKIDLYRCNGTSAQQWTYNTNQELVNANGKCLNDAGYGGQGSKVILWTCEGTVNEEWFHSFDGEWVSYDHLNNHSSPPSALCLNDPAYSTKPGTQQIMWQNVGSVNERYTSPQS